MQFCNGLLRGPTQNLAMAELPRHMVEIHAGNLAMVELPCQWADLVVHKIGESSIALPGRRRALHRGGRTACLLISSTNSVVVQYHHQHAVKGRGFRTQPRERKPTMFSNHHGAARAAASRPAGRRNLPDKGAGLRWWSCEAKEVVPVIAHNHQRPALSVEAEGEIKMGHGGACIFISSPSAKSILR